MLEMKKKLMEELMERLADMDDALAKPYEMKECAEDEEEIAEDEEPKVQVKAMKIVAKPEEMEDDFEPDDSKDDERKPRYKNEDYPFFPKKKK